MAKRKLVYDDEPEESYSEAPQEEVQEDVQEEPSFWDSAWDTAKDVADFFTQPAQNALKVLSYLDKPRGMIAGGVKAALDNTDIIEGIKNGWDENTSWGEMIPYLPGGEEFKEEHPYISAGAGFGADVALDPMWLVPPAKMASGAQKVSKAVGLTDNVINPAVNAFRNSRFGKNAIATTEDILGKNRVNEAGIDMDFNYGRAQDALEDSDITDDIVKLKKQYGDDSAKQLTQYVEAAERPSNPMTMTPQMETDIIDSFQRGDMAKDIAGGVYSKENALDALRGNRSPIFEEDIPDYLLQQHQIDDILQGRGVPDYVYRDQILSQIQDPNLRSAIQHVGDSVIARNKDYQSKLKSIGMLGDESAVHFQGGSHLRRSYEKYETPEDFLEVVRKNGTPEEWQRVFEDYQKMKGNGVGPAHKISTKDFIQRQRLSSETMQKMGLVEDAQYRATDTFNRASKTLRENQYLSDVAAKFGKDADEAARLSRDSAMAREYVPVPNTKEYGALAGKWIPTDVANQVMKRLGIKNDSVPEWWKKFVSHWKVGKLANPASIMRNFYSGLPMANAFGKVPMKDMPMLMKEVSIAMAKGKKSNLWREYLGSGAKESKFSKADMDNILSGSTHGVMGKIRKLENIGMDAFGLPDDFWRAVVFAHYRRKGLDIKAAGEKARKALLDYENTPEWVSKLGRTGIVPFARFPFHATKATAKALWENPATVTKYYKPVNHSDKDTMDILPDYLEPQNLVAYGDGTRVVDGKEIPVKKHFDMSYVLPFANDVSIGNPAMSAWQLYNTGKNGLGQQVIRPGMSNKDKAEVYFNEVVRNGMAPAVLSKYTWDKLGNAITGKVDSKGRAYDLEDAIEQTMLGIKKVPVNIEEEYTKRQTGLKNDARNIQTEINRIKKDKSLTDEQKAEDIKEYERQKANVEKQQKELAERYTKYLPPEPEKPQKPKRGKRKKDEQKQEQPRPEKPKKPKRKLSD